MTREQLEHAIRAACDVADDGELNWVKLTVEELG